MLELPKWLHQDNQRIATWPSRRRPYTLSYPDKFEHKIRDLNLQGVNLINLERENEALTYLLEAERILEYAASCGKTIDRVLITATLQNEACAYQRLWDLEKSSDYMEAIIYNIKASLDATPFIQYDATVKDEQSQAYS